MTTTHIAPKAVVAIAWEDFLTQMKSAGYELETTQHPLDGAVRLLELNGWSVVASPRTDYDAPLTQPEPVIPDVLLVSGCERHFPNTPNTCLLYTSPSPRDS